LPRRRLGVGGQQAEAPALPNFPTTGSLELHAPLHRSAATVFISNRGRWALKGHTAQVPLDAGSGDNGLVPGAEQNNSATKLAWCEEAAERTPSLAHGRSCLSEGGWLAAGAYLETGDRTPSLALGARRGAGAGLEAQALEAAMVPLDAGGDNGLAPGAERRCGTAEALRSAEAVGQTPSHADKGGKHLNVVDAWLCGANLEAVERTPSLAGGIQRGDGAASRPLLLAGGAALVPLDALCRDNGFGTCGGCTSRCGARR
jgi:hypothetical protein